MFCWQARRRFAVHLEGSSPAASRGRLEAHLAACAPCRRQLDDLAGVSGLVAEAGRIDGPVLTPAESEGFEATLMRAIRSRAIEPRVEAASGFLGPVPITAAASIMILMAMAALLLGSPAARDRGPAALAEAETAFAGQQPAGRDTIVAPQEVPFTYVEDLVGARRGRIPLTTYVLEPAPEEKPVVRASL